MLYLTAATEQRGDLDMGERVADCYCLVFHYVSIVLTRGGLHAQHDRPLSHHFVTQRERAELRHTTTNDLVCHYCTFNVDPQVEVSLHTKVRRCRTWALVIAAVLMSKSHISF